MNSYRMIAIDLDGTLLSPTGEVTPRARQAVHKCLSAGLLVCFATGRNWTESQAVLEAVDHYPTAVFVGGAMVIDTKHRQTIHRTLMGPELAAELCQFLEAQGHAALALQDTASAGVDYLISGDVPLDEATRQWMSVTQAKVKSVGRLAEQAHEHTIRVGICASKEEIEKVKTALAAAFEQRVVYQNLLVPAYGVEVLEVFDPAVNKWEGILHVARHHGINAEQIVAIGDDVNDIPMIQNAGLGIAMGNARQPVLAVARRVIGANHDEGLAEFLEELVESHAVQPLPERER